MQLRLLEIHWTEARQAKVEALFEMAAKHALAHLYPEEKREGP